MNRNSIVSKIKLKLKSVYYICYKFLFFKKIQYGYKKKIKDLKRKEKINVAFLIMYISDCQCLSLFEMMKDSNKFIPFFIVNPDVARGEEHLFQTYETAKKALIEKYGAQYVFDGYNFDKKEGIDYSSKVDIVITNNPYDSMADQYFKSIFWAQRKIPLCYICYYYFGRDKDVSGALIRSDFFNLLWKYFAENSMVYKWIKKESVLKGKNVYVSGYPKLDVLNNAYRKNEKKVIILAPHHTIGNIGVGTYSIGSFLDTADFLFNLPDKYEGIDFVFRPHPLLKQNLYKEEYWGKEKTDKWFNDFCSKKNVTFSNEGDYFDLFINSSAMIHDCGSFTAEYLCTGNPCAYILKHNLQEDETFTEFGKECIHSHYLINSENDIYNFIDNVVLNGNDTMKEKRVSFAKNVIMYNNPNATKAIFDCLSNSLI